MKILLAVALLSLAACSTVMAEGKGGKLYTCTPADPAQRGPFEPKAPEGEPLTVKAQ